MKFQSKYRNHKLMFRPSKYVYNPDMTRSVQAGITIDFTGSQRIYDTTLQQRLNGWPDETREQVEDYILQNKNYGQGIYLAPGEVLPPEKQDLARVKPKDAVRKCLSIGFDDKGELTQCPDEPTAGRDYCPAHDPEEVKITRGMSTTAD